MIAQVTTRPSIQILKMMDPQKQGQMTVDLKNGKNTSSDHLSKKVLACGLCEQTIVSL